ncbi:unnamed protein product [Dibothriocephalus latus]|uniref:Uncharacterized protein n=1 Tax=Dibothriocephalus latus TaxID=60516 RepID=A0A3P6SF05_DIBLA|nr:unnamed protein product [Dibothriocephalus latus]
MEETTLASPSDREEISILREEKPADHPGLSSNGCSLPKGTGSISDQKQCPLNVPDADLVDEFQKVFPAQTEEEEDAPVIENPDDLLPTTQENAPFTQEIPGGRTDSLEPAHLSSGATGNISNGASDDEEEQGEESKTDGEHFSAHVLENSTNEDVEDMGNSSTMGHESERNVFCEGLPQVEGDTTNETSNKLLTAKMEENLDLTCPEQYSDLNIQPDLGFAEQKEHQDDYATLHIAEDEGPESTGTPTSPSPLPEDSARLSVQMPTEKNLPDLGDVEQFSANEILEVDAPSGEEVQTQAESADTEDTGKTQIVDPYFEEEEIRSKCSESQSSAKSIVNYHTPSSPVEPQSQACEPEEGTAVGEVVSSDNLHQPQQDDLVQANNQTNQSLPSSEASHTDLVSSDADLLETCVNITQTEPAKSIEQEEAEKTGTAKQIFTAQETTAKCEDTSHASDSESDDNMECMDTLQPHLHWASTAEETDTTDGTSVEAVFPLQFTKLEVKANEEDVLDNPTVSENFCEKHEVSYCLTLPTETLNSANDTFMVPDSPAPQKPNPDVLTAFQNCIDIRESPDGAICSLSTANALQMVEPEEDEKVVAFATPAAEAFHAHQTPGGDFNLCECVPQQVFVQFSGDNTYLTNAESGIQPQVDGGSESPVLLEPAEEVAASPPSPTVEATEPAIAPQSTSDLDKPQVYVIPPDEEEDPEHLLVVSGISDGSSATTEYSDIQLESPLPTDVPPAMEPIIEITDLPSQQNSPFVHESGDEIYDSSNRPNVCGEIQCSPAEDNEADHDNAHVAEMSVNDTPKVEEAVSCFFAETASVDETSEEIVEEQLTEVPS